MPTAGAAGEPIPRRRADAVRNAEVILDAAKAAFAETGVTVPVREIAARAGVGVGTLYRAYPQRSDLVIAVFRREVDATAAAAHDLAGEDDPPEALRRWAEHLAAFVATKHGFIDALHSGDPAYQPLPDYFVGTLAPGVQQILDTGARDGSLRRDVDARELVLALTRLIDADTGEDAPGVGRMASLLIDGVTTGTG